MRLSLLALPIALAGCASGTIIGSDPGESRHASLLNAPKGTVLAVMPLHSTKEWTAPQTDTEWTLWVSEGWFEVMYACDTLEEDGEVVRILLREYDTTRNIKVHPGRSYELTCSPDVLGILRIKDTGAAPNQPLHPDASRTSALSAGERRRYE